MKNLQKATVGIMSLGILGVLAFANLDSVNLNDDNKELAQVQTNEKVQFANGRGRSPLGIRAWTDGSFWYNQPGGYIIC